MKRSIFISLLVLPLYVCIMGIAIAQEPMEPPFGPPKEDGFFRPRRDEPKMRKFLYRNLEKYLGLDEAASKRFQPIFIEYGEVRGGLMREQHETYRKIDAVVDNESTPLADVQALAQKYSSIHKSLWQEREKFLKVSKKILTPRQMIKLLIFEDKMKEDIFRRMRKDDSNPPELPNFTLPLQPR